MSISSSSSQNVVDLSTSNSNGNDDKNTKEDVMNSVVFMEEWNDVMTAQQQQESNRRWLQTTDDGTNTTMTNITNTTIGTNITNIMTNMTNTTNMTKMVCDAFNIAYYKTPYEALANPCNNCTYDNTTLQLNVSCNYQYCTECNTTQGICGYREVNFDYKFTNQNEVDTFLMNQTIPKNLKEIQYCINYTEGKTGTPCVDVGKYLDQQCSSNIVRNIPLLTCTETSGCICYKNGDTIDKNNPFVGFQTIEFESCYTNITNTTTTLNKTSTSSSAVLFLSPSLLSSSSFVFTIITTTISSSLLCFLLF